MKYIFQYGELDSTKIIEEITKTKKKLVNIISYFSNKNTVLLLFIKYPPRRRLHFSLLFTIREADVITSFYQVTAMEQLDTLIFDAIIKLRNNKKQPNENSIHTLMSKDSKSLSKKQLEERLLTLTKENHK